MEACHNDDENFSGFSDFTGKAFQICLVPFVFDFLYSMFYEAT
jgi:hypothetical protein